MPTINYLKFLRGQKNIKKEQLAVIVKRKPITIQSYEKRKKRVPIDIAIIMANYFQLPSPEPLTGFIKKIYITDSEYKKILPNFKVELSEKPTQIFEILNIHKRKISLKDCHALILNKNMAKGFSAI